MKEKKGIHYFFLRPKPVKILMYLSKNDDLNYASSISKQADCTYSHAVKILKLLEKKGIIEFNKKGRLKTISLTSEGKEIANYLSKTMFLFDKLDSR